MQTILDPGLDPLQKKIRQLLLVNTGPLIQDVKKHS
jgi:hypothetical protein